MQAILSGKLSIAVLLLFVVFIACGFLIRALVLKMRKELDIAQYTAARGPIEEAPQPPDAKDCLPGYTLLTQKNYDEIYAALLREFGAGQKRG